MSSPASGPTPFVIISAPRCASTMLSSMLASRPDFVVCGELLNNVWIDEGGSLSLARDLDPEGQHENDPSLHQLRRQDPIKLLQEVHGMAVELGAAAFGFKLLYVHGYSRPRVVEYLASLARLMVLHITRLDPLARLISLHRDPEACAADFEEQRQLGEHYRSALATCRTLELTYESLEADPNAVAESVQRFLGFEPEPLRVHTHKQARQTPRQSIANWDELAARFAGTRWQHLFLGTPGPVG